MFYNNYIMKTNVYIVSALVIVFALTAYSLAASKKIRQEKKMYATFETSLGNITCQLFPESAPMTVKNFVGLAKGEITWSDPKTNEKTNKPLYDGTIFHRVIPDFMIQGGDPLGMGIGGPGYRFEDEIDPKLTFAEKGILAMANSGPNTNGSQFFITVAPTPWLNEHHTIFGKVVKGQDVADKISLVEKDSQDKPLKSVVLKKITITEK